MSCASPFAMTRRWSTKGIHLLQVLIILILWKLFFQNIFQKLFIPYTVIYPWSESFLGFKIKWNLSVTPRSLIRVRFFISWWAASCQKTIVPLADRCDFRIVIYIYFSRSYCAFAFSWFSLRFRFLDLDCLPIYSSVSCLSTYCRVSLWPFWKVFHHTTINVKYWCTQKAKGKKKGGEGRGESISCRSTWDLTEAFITLHFFTIVYLWPRKIVSVPGDLKQSIVHGS